MFDARRFLEDILHLPARVIRALKGGGVGKGHVHVEIADVFIRQELRGKAPADKDDEERDRCEENEAEDALPDEGAAHGHVAFGGPVEHPVKPREEGAERPVGLARLEKQCAQGGGQGQGGECRDYDRDGDGDRELLVESARDARE